jgi:GLPGLI family protein
MSSDPNGRTESPIKPETFSFSYSNQKSLYEMISSQKSSIDTSYIFHKGVKLETYDVVTLADVDITYKDLKNNKILKEYNIRNSDFSAKDKLPNYEWTITNEKAIINGYKCKKATTKKTFVPTTAWFTEEIPISDGPDEYWGLPGLIIKLELGGYSTITLETIKTTTENSEIKEPQNKSTQLTLDNFYSSIDAYLEGTSPLNKYK